MLKMLHPYSCPTERERERFPKGLAYTRNATHVSDRRFNCLFIGQPDSESHFREVREVKPLRCWTGVLIAVAFLMMPGCSIRLPESSFAVFKGSAEKTGSIKLPDDKAQQHTTRSIKPPEGEAQQEQSI
jgi:hypothetical protein